MNPDARYLDIQLTLLLNRISDSLTAIVKDTGITYNDSSVAFEINATFADGTGPQAFVKKLDIKGPFTSGTTPKESNS